MSIEYRPPNVGYMLALSSAEKRLGTREGYVVFIDPEGQHAREPISGMLLDVHAVALAHDRQSPDHKIVVFEHGCGANGVPSTLPTNVALNSNK